jgi:6-pyruvoyltetrahydropterin/6-carboxytetrahydropterin synthase
MGHGHNYVLEVTVAGEPSQKTGYVIDLKKLKEIVKREILDKVDHKHLNYEVDFLSGIIPTAENIAKGIWSVLEPKIKEGRLYSVRLHETENNSVEYRGE